MSFKSNTEIIKFKKISIDNFIQIYKKRNPNENFTKLRNNLLHFKKGKKKRRKIYLWKPYLGDWICNFRKRLLYLYNG